MKKTIYFLIIGVFITAPYVVSAQPTQIPGKLVSGAQVGGVNSFDDGLMGAPDMSSPKMMGNHGGMQGNHSGMQGNYEGNGEASGEGRGIPKTDDGGWQVRKDAAVAKCVKEASKSGSYNEEVDGKWCEDNFNHYW